MATRRGPQEGRSERHGLCGCGSIAIRRLGQFPSSPRRRGPMCPGLTQHDFLNPASSGLGSFVPTVCCALAGRLTSLKSPRAVSKRRRPRLRRSARCADYPAVLESAGGRRKLAALRQSTAESPARSCAHRRRNGDRGYGGELRSRLSETWTPEGFRPNRSTLDPSSYRRRPVSRERNCRALNPGFRLSPE